MLDQSLDQPVTDQRKGKGWGKDAQRHEERTAQAMAEGGVEDPYDTDAVRRLGVIDLPAIQRKTNLHFSLTLDLFGSEESTNAANFFNAGIKGRFHEDRIDDDHRLVGTTYPVMKTVDGELRQVDVPALNALNARLRDDFIEDCQAGINRWNNEISEAGIDFEITLPHVAFNRSIGEFSDISVTPDGDIVTREEFEARKSVFRASDTRTFDPTYQSYVGTRLGCHVLAHLEGFEDWAKAPAVLVTLLASLVADTILLPYTGPRDLLLEPADDAP